MERLRVAGHWYSDPDVIALIRAGGGLSDPRSLVLTQARKLNSQYRLFDASNVSPIARLTHIASLKGLKVSPMSFGMSRKEARDAVILLSGDQQRNRGHIFYNPDRPASRVAFSIAHEISHTFFPNTSGGTRFREMCDSESREANELERLCDLGASELLMPILEFRKATGSDWSIDTVPRLSQIFGGSFEATTFRLASAHPGVAAAGSLTYRRRKDEQLRVERLQASAGQGRLFLTKPKKSKADVPEPKYRRHSFFTSELFPPKGILRWNKSFNEDSGVYRASLDGHVAHFEEPLPNNDETAGHLEVVRAPYQRTESDVDHPDLLFFWSKPLNDGPEST